jgi:hypothetical protein
MSGQSTIEIEDCDRCSRQIRERRLHSAEVAGATVRQMALSFEFAHVETQERRWTKTNVQRTLCPSGALRRSPSTNGDTT